MSDSFQQFLSNLALLGVGSLVSYFLIHRYQKTKDIREIRERLLNLHTDAKRSLLKLQKYWAQVIAKITLQNIAQDARELPSDVELPMVLFDAHMEFKIAITQILGILRVNFKPTRGEEKFFRALQNKITLVSNLIQQAIIKKNLSADLGKETFDLLQKFDYLLDIILEIDPK